MGSSISGVSGEIDAFPDDARLDDLTEDGVFLADHRDFRYAGEFFYCLLDVQWMHAVRTHLDDVAAATVEVQIALSIEVTVVTELDRIPTRLPSRPCGVSSPFSGLYMR